MGTATYAAIALPIFLGFAALAIDLSLIGYEKSNLQLASDSAALAAAEYLDSEENDITLVHGESASLARMHISYNSFIRDQQVETQIGDFSLDGGFVENTESGDYVKVTITNPSLPPVFGGLFGYQSYYVSSSSVAGKVYTRNNECVPVMENEWPCLMFASESLELTGNFSLGINYSLENSSVCTNAESITLGGSLSVQNGIDMHMGPDCESTNGISCIDSHGGAYTFNGDTTPMGLEVTLPSVEYPDDYTALPNGVRVGGRNGGTVTTIYSGESYFVDGDLSTTSNQSINISGAASGCTSPQGIVSPAIIYVNGNVSLSGGVTGNTAHPECFEIRVIGERTVRINGRTTFSGNIYAPESEVYPNGNAEFRGTIMARSIRANGNHNIILDAGQGSRVPHSGDDVTCEDQEVLISLLRVVR